MNFCYTQAATKAMFGKTSAPEGKRVEKKISERVHELYGFSELLCT